MSNVPLINASVTITAIDINGNSVIKQFNSVSAIHLDYSKGVINIVDATGSFFFGLTTLSALTYTIVTGVNGSTTVVIT